MLGIAECLCMEKGLDWAFCDTDSLAIAKPDKMDQSEFFERAQSICDWFSPSIPMRKRGSIFKIEDANYPIRGPQDEFAIRGALLLSAFPRNAMRLFNHRKGRRNRHSQGLGAWAWAIPPTI